MHIYATTLLFAICYSQCKRDEQKKRIVLTCFIYFIRSNHVIKCDIRVANPLLISIAFFFQIFICSLCRHKIDKCFSPKFLKLNKLFLFRIQFLSDKITKSLELLKYVRETSIINKERKKSAWHCTVHVGWHFD